jgi:hypothetical protein
MGGIISVVTLMMGAIVVGVLSSMTANYSRKANWSSAEKYAIITSVAAALFAIIAIIMLIVMKQKGSSMSMMIMAAYIFLVVCMLATAGMNVGAALAAKKQDKSRAEGLSAGGAALSFFSFIASIAMFFLI